MPNIEMHGFLKNDPRRQKVMIEIINTAVNLNLIKEMVITEYENKSNFIYQLLNALTNWFGAMNTWSTPYLRVCSTSPGEIQAIIDGLKKRHIGIDVEYLVLDGFIPAEEMK